MESIIIMLVVVNTLGVDTCMHTYMLAYKPCIRGLNPTRATYLCYLFFLKIISVLVPDK